MPPMRSGIGQRFGRVDGVALKLAVALVVGSVLFALTKNSFGAVLPLQPDDVLSHLMVWQPLTYGLVGSGPLDVIFGALIVWSIGSALEATWGSRRLLGFAAGTTVIAGFLTVALSLVSLHIRGFFFFGAAVLATNLWVAYGLSYGRAQTNFWGMPVSGNVFALIGAGFVFLNGAYGGWIAVIPEVLGLALTAVYVKWGSPRVFWLRFTSWRLHRQLKGRSRHLKVITKERNIGGGSDGFLH